MYKQKSSSHVEAITFETSAEVQKSFYWYLRTRMATPDDGKKQQSSYTLAFKLEVIAWYRENGENKHETSRCFGIDKKRV